MIKLPKNPNYGDTVKGYQTFLDYDEGDILYTLDMQPPERVVLEWIKFDPCGLYSNILERPEGLWIKQIDGTKGFVRACKDNIYPTSKEANKAFHDAKTKYKKKLLEIETRIASIQFALKEI